MKNSARQKQPEQNKQREDHLAPTKIEISKPIKGTERNENLTHGEVQNKLEVYGRIGHLMHQHNVVQDIKERYQNEIGKVAAVRTQADINYSMGIRSGLPHASYETLRNTREMTDQNFRDVITKEAKARYQEKDNLTKRFSEQRPYEKGLRQDFTENRNKGMDRER